MLNVEIIGTAKGDEIYEKIKTFTEKGFDTFILTSVKEDTESGIIHSEITAINSESDI